MCVYLVSQLAVPVALVNERLSEGLEPNDSHAFRQVRCPDTGVECQGYGEVRAAVRVVPRRSARLMRQQSAAGRPQQEGGEA